MMSDQKEAELLEQLVDEFRALLDEPLIAAMAGDYDLQNESQYMDARSSLQQLASGAKMEEANGFIASGLGEYAQSTDAHAPDRPSETSPSETQSDSKSQSTEPSSTDTSASSSDHVYEIPRLVSFDNDSQTDKATQLLSIFTDLKEHDVQFALRKAKGNFHDALDELINIQNARASGQEMKGVDGFFVDDESTTRKRKGESRSGHSQESSGTATPREAEKTMMHADEIGLLADALSHPFEDVATIFTNKQYMRGPTVVEILDRNLASGIIAHDETSKRQAAELSKQHPKVPEKYMLALIQATSTSQLCDELAGTLNKHFIKHPWTRKLNLSYGLRPSGEEADLLTAGSTNGRSGSRSAKSTPPTTPRPMEETGVWLLGRNTEALNLANYHQGARRDAHAAAAKLSRGGGQYKHLSRQAAGVYAERAQDHGRWAQQATSMAADMLVNRTATSSQIDLHGVSVQDGTRIACERVQEWWDGLGDFRSRKARERPFTVITGLGRHSAGGVSQLRKSVTPALLGNGWKLEAETGRVMVTGRR